MSLDLISKFGIVCTMSCAALPIQQTTVSRVASADLPTDFGKFRIIGYRSLISAEEFVVLVKGELDNRFPINVNIHLQCLAGDVFGSLTCDCNKRLRGAMERIANEKAGVIIYQQQTHVSVATVINSNHELGVARYFEQSAEILLDLGITNISTS
jgi:GTP cyclohydrolase II